MLCTLYPSPYFPAILVHLFPFLAPSMVILDTGAICSVFYSNLRLVSKNSSSPRLRLLFSLRRMDLPSMCWLATVECHIRMRLLFTACIEAVYGAVVLNL
uniref:Uncharacterized protein n=1 Tax=Schistocephalus solidus TaxID=70667 RepID=A0A0X3Q4U2_SCHSO